MREPVETDSDQAYSQPATKNGGDRAHIIVFGNEKGGSGKSTTAMHVAIALMRMGYSVGTLDLDARQGTLTRYMSNRFSYAIKSGNDLPSPSHMAITRSTADRAEDQLAEETEFVDMAVAELAPAHDFIVIDTPGTDSNLSRYAHAMAQTLITPVNDSLVDLDVLARIDADTLEIQDKSVYTQMVMEQRALHLDWIVMRNRLSHIDARNKRDIADLLERLADLYGFRLVAGFGERVVFRELFLKGLTLLDMREEEGHIFSMSELTARQEVRQLIRAIGPEAIRGRPDNKKRETA